MRISDWSSDVCSSDLKHRLIWVPPGQQASTAADGHIDFPIGSLIVKSFGWPEQNGGRPVETRLLIHRADGWTALPYIWDADGKDATLALAGRRVPVSFKRSAEHTSELPSLMRTSYAVFCLQNKIHPSTTPQQH